MDEVSNLKREISALKQQIEDLKEKSVNHPSSKYIVPNYYTPQQLGLENDEVDAFKEFVINWACESEDLTYIMEELVENFRDEKEEKKEEEDERYEAIMSYITFEFPSQDKIKLYRFAVEYEEKVEKIYVNEKLECRDEIFMNWVQEKLMSEEEEEEEEEEEDEV